MKDFKSFLKENGENHVVLVYGRMNPPTVGHLQVIKKVKEISEQYHADHCVILSHTHDAKKNPLTPEQKLHYVKEYFPDINVELSTKECSGIIQQARKLNEKYTHLHIVAGGDRIQEYKELLEQYNGSDYQYNQILFHSSGERNEEPGVTSISGTKMRESAKTGKYGAFLECVPSYVSDKTKHELYVDIRKGSNLQEQKALFVIGPPASGKDIIISNLLETYSLVEASPEQIQKKLFVLNNDHLLVSATATETQPISEAAKKLIENGFDVGMIFVAISDDESKIRHSSRKKSINENVRHTKWETSLANAELFQNTFEKFMLFDNSNSLHETVEQISNVVKFTEYFFGINNDGLNESFNQFALEEDKSGNAARAAAYNKKMNKTTATQFIGKIKSDTSINRDYNTRLQGSPFPTNGQLSSGMIEGDDSTPAYGFTGSSSNEPATTLAQQTLDQMKAEPKRKKLFRALRK